MNPLKYFKIFDRETCPCGSGKNYIDCCKSRGDKKQKPSKKPLDVQILEKLRKSLFKCCLHPDKNHCVRHIKEAHALQNNKIISELSENGHVYIMNFKKPPLIIPIEGEEPEIMTEIGKVGVNHATTATCFCDLHDDVTFAAIEKGAPAFDKESDEHKFLYAYKAFIFEYYKKLVERNGLINEIKETPSLLKKPLFVQQYRAISMTINEMQTVKNFFDKRILNKDYSDIETCVIEIDGKINFANYACIALDFDLEGKKIKNVKKGFMSRLFVTVFPEETKSYILLSCLKDDYRIYKNLFLQMKRMTIGKIKYYFDLVLPLYSENVVISPRLWEKWNDEQKNAYTFYANRKGKQFLVYRKALLFGMHNIRKVNDGFGEGQRGKLDLFEKI